MSEPTAREACGCNGRLAVGEGDWCACGAHLDQRFNRGPERSTVGHARWCQCGCWSVQTSYTVLAQRGASTTTNAKRSSPEVGTDG